MPSASSARSQSRPWLDVAGSLTPRRAATLVCRQIVGFVVRETPSGDSEGQALADVGGGRGDDDLVVARVHTPLPTHVVPPQKGTGAELDGDLRRRTGIECDLAPGHELLRGPVD